MYKCNRSFTAHNNHKYSYGQKISGIEYNSLSYVDQQNFSRVEDEPSYSTSRPVEDPPSFSMPSFDSSSSFDSTPDNSSSFDFGGGDGGGGGATGDF